MMSYMKKRERLKGEVPQDLTWISPIPFQGLPFFIFNGGALFDCCFGHDRCKAKKERGAAARLAAQNVSMLLPPRRPIFLLHSLSPVYDLSRCVHFV